MYENLSWTHVVRSPNGESNRLRGPVLLWTRHDTGPCAGVFPMSCHAVTEVSLRSVRPGLPFATLRGMCPDMLPFLRIQGSIALLTVAFVGAGCDDNGFGSKEAEPVAQGDKDRSGNTVDVAPASPSLLPCPDGWEERVDEELGVSLCEPWPASTPGRRDCPDGWSILDVNGVATCEPWPGTSPVNWSCPEGWRQVIDDDVGTCEPSPREGPCGVYEAQFPGEVGCVSVGTECPDGDFPEGLPGDVPIVYVKPGFRGGDGSSPASPLGSLNDVFFPALPHGTIVAMAKGTHRSTGRLDRDITLWGACTAETILTAPSPRPVNLPGILLSADSSGPSSREVVVKNLRIENTPQVGLAVRGRMRLRLEGVVVERTQAIGLFADDGGRLSAFEVIVRDTRPTPRGELGFGLEVRGGGTAELRRVVFDRNRVLGVFANEPNTSLVLEDSVIRGTESRQADRNRGRGLSVEVGAAAEVRRTVFERNRDVGVSVSGASTHAVMEDILVRDTRSNELSQSHGGGLRVVSGAKAAIRRALFAGNRDFGVFVSGGDTELSLEDAVIRDTRSEESNRTGGIGLTVVGGARAEVRRSVLDRNRAVSVLVNDANTHLVLEDAMIRDTQSQESDQMLGRGLQLGFDGSAEVRRMLITRNRQAGVVASGAGVRLVLEDFVVRDTQSQEADQTGGYGIQVSLGAIAEVRRGLFGRNRSVAVQVGGTNAQLILEDAVVRNTLRQASDQALGRGLEVGFGASAVVRRTLFDHNREVGVMAGGEGTWLRLEDTVVRDTQSRAKDGDGGRGLLVQFGAQADVRQSVIQRNQDIAVFVLDSEASLTDSIVDRVNFPPCAEKAEPCPALAVGVLSSGQNAAMLVERVRIGKSDQCGVFLGRGGQLDGTDLVIVQNGVGACFEDPLYDPARLGAEFIDNAERILFQDLPEALQPFDL